MNEVRINQAYILVVMFHDHFFKKNKKERECITILAIKILVAKKTAIELRCWINFLKNNKNHE